MDGLDVGIELLESEIDVYKNRIEHREKVLEACVYEYDMVLKDICESLLYRDRLELKSKQNILDILKRSV